MAKKVVDEELRYTIIINGDKGQKELYELEKATRKLREANKDLRAEQSRLAAQGQKGSEAYKRITAEIKNNNAAIKANDAQMKKLRSQIGITGLTMAQLTKEASRLRLALRNMTPGSADYKRYQNELNQVNNRLRELRLGANQTKTSLRGIADGFNRFQALSLALIASVTGVVISFQKLIDFQGKLSDAQADVAKTTGLSAEAVDELTASLGLLKTRSARIELLALAEEAGRLGISAKEDILEFVQTADQIKVALGDDLQGDINENIRIIGKLTEQYQVGADIGATFGQGMTMIGSAINEVAASGAAQAGYLVDYTSRLVGISRQANISAQDQIGFASVLDEAGQRVETSATATSQAIIGMFKDTDTYAGIAGIAVTDFRKLLETDANEAFLRFLQGLNGNNEGLEQLAQKFDGLGIDGSRAISVLATLASQTDKIREKQDLANNSLNEATSLQEESNKKNTNFAAILDRINKRLGQLIVNSSLVQWLKEGIKWFAVFIGAIDDATSSAHRWREIIVFTAKALAVLVATLISYKAGLIVTSLATKGLSGATYLLNIQQKVMLVKTQLLRSATLLFAAAQAILTGNIGRASAAMRVFNAVTKLNPVGLVLGAVTATAAALVVYSNRLKEASIQQKVLNDVTAETGKSISKETSTIRRLLFLAKSESLTREKRIEAVEKLNALSPQYLGNIKLEEINYVGTKKAIDQYIDSIRKVAEERAIANRAQALEDKLAVEQTTALDEYTNAAEEWAYKDEYLKKIQLERQNEAIRGIHKEIEALQELEVARKKNESFSIQNNDPLSQNILASSSQDKPNPGGETPEEKAARLKREEEAKKQAESEAKRALAQFKALKEKISELERQAELERMQANKREIAEIRDKYSQLRKEAEGHAEEIKRINALEDEEIRLKQLEQQALSEEDRIKKEEETQKEIQRLREQYGLVTQQELYDAELLQLQSALEKELLTLEEFLKAKQNLEKKYAELSKANNSGIFSEDRLEQIAQGFGRLSASVNNLMQMEIARNQVVRKSGENEEDFTARKRAEEQKRYQIEKKYANIRMLTTIGEIISQTALAVMKAAPIIPLQVLMGVLGATQLGLATAEHQKIQGFEEGLYPVLDHKGRKFNAGIQTNAPTGKLTEPTILAGEKPEIIIDPLTTRHLEMNYPQVINAIYSSAARVRGYESGHYPERSTQSAADTEIMSQIAAALAINASAIAELRSELKNGIAAYYDDAQVREIRTRLEVNNAVKQARTLWAYPS